MIKPSRDDKELWLEWKKYRLEKSREYHKDLIEDLGIEEKDFNMKKIFRDKNNKEIVYIFPSEFKKEKGLFFEIINSDLEPDDPERKVYRLTPSSCFEEEYQFNDRTSQYEVPVEELRVVNNQAVAISKSSAVTSSDKVLNKIIGEKIKEKIVFNTKVSLPLEDAPLSDMTIRDYITIHTNNPVSLKPWLNELIKSSK